MPPNPFRKLFMSYRSTDSKQVDMIIARLRTLKAADGNPRFHVWQDKDGIPEGQDWWEAIVEALIACNVLIFMISRDSVKNTNCRAELNYARKRNRPVIPVVLEGEYFYNPKTGKNDIDFWGDIPEELNDLRAQFLFYEGASFVDRLERALEQFAREPQRWRDLPASNPRDPRQTSDESNNVIALYDEACDYAWRVEFGTAERLFTRLINMNDPIFSDDAHQWILLLREYQTVIALDARQSTRHKAKPQWEAYVKRFPVAFINGVFDPKDMQSRYSAAAIMAKPQPSAPPAETPSPAPTPQRTSSPPKPRSKVVEILPRPFEWIDIPAGKVTLEKGGYLNVSLTYNAPAFTIAKYPITNAQFAKFIEAGGYNQKRWWTNAGWTQRESDKWTQPRYWTDAKWNGAEHPVVGVSWYEAIAFCRWLTEVIGGQSVGTITLPTEQQWQRAAQGDQGLMYPWGNDFNAARCNTSESEIGKTTPITQYAGKGDSPFGVTDMVGNVWEWCLTDYYSGAIELEGTDRRCLRGGSWRNTQDFALATLRYNFDPSARYGALGFRVVVSSPIF